ncbi:FUSC family protein [Macrococcus equipercicus]|uniref:Aromatic acid exporter family protein n=1 Tax=Macrococcus equipercicus TaxID=69967 RepID=A0A9Q9F1H6_9STAP|nr:aromatic acid exporter family protein [Macrococcus equipercicus]KAA1037664.1 aromatic acid exporter family protein [Macrococcus equipercicus]UTH13376.1 aromatic acid exporter family protein [Macrococcus equipercicus]
MKLGARIFKTGVSIALALFLAQFISLQGSVVSGISALFAMQPSVYKSYKTIIEQFQGNIIGALLAVAMVQLFGVHILIIALSSIILIAVLSQLKLQNVTGLAVVTQLIIMDHHQGDFFQTALMRFAFVMIGVISASIVNLVFLPPKYETKLYYNCLNVCGDIFKWIRLSINGTSEYHIVKKDLEEFHSRITSLESQYNLYKDERAYTKRQAYQNTRKKILFKEMISATRKAYELLRKLNRYENDILNLPEDLRIQMKFELDELMSYHEELLMRVTNKVSLGRAANTSLVNDQFKEDLLDVYLKELNSYHAREENYYKQHVFQVIGAMFEYREKLEHLDTLTHSFYNYHKEEKKITVEDENFDM